ncbi:hypothetical protein B0H14DRAFT_2572539 [Mycena olivaceomarginata]|nr:hypothetical protein B0H14DRAFT_2572539 [Mycena olivaceomarginata]
MSCAIDDTDSAESLASFLIRHPTLTHLHLGASQRAHTSPGMRIPLLNLQWYAGPIGLLRSMDVGALREARIRCSTIHSKIENTIVALKLLTRPDIPFVFSHERREYLDFCARLVDVLSKHIPHTQTIRLPAVHGYLSLVIQRITASIRRFTRLEFLAIEYHTSQWMMHENMSIPLQALGNACPTLEACQLSDLAWRKVDGMWEDCSLEDFRLLAGLNASKKAVLIPFVGVRYHLNEWNRSGRQPETPEELFNLRHVFQVKSEVVKCSPKLGTFVLKFKIHNVSLLIGSFNMQNSSPPYYLAARATVLATCNVTFALQFDAATLRNSLTRPQQIYMLYEATLDGKLKDYETVKEMCMVVAETIRRKGAKSLFGIQT